MTLHLTYEERKKRTRENQRKYRERNEERLKIYNKEYYINNVKNNNKYYNYNKKHTKNIYSDTDTKKDKERKLIYIMNYFISNNIIWT